MRLSFWPFVCLSLLLHVLFLRPHLPDILSGASAAPSTAGGSVALRFSAPPESPASAVLPEESVSTAESVEPAVPEGEADQAEPEEEMLAPEASEALLPEASKTAESPESLGEASDTEEKGNALRLEKAEAEQPERDTESARKLEVEKTAPMVERQEPLAESTTPPFPPKTENAAAKPQTSTKPEVPAPSEPVVKPEAQTPARPAAVPNTAANVAPDAPPDSALVALPPQSSTGPEPELLLGQGNAPSYDKFVPPQYPENLRRRGVSGSVRLRVLVSAQGQAEQVEVLRSTHPQFTGPARDSARRSTYRPLLRNGRAEACWVTLTMSFDLK